METPFFFDNNGYRLFGILHEPVTQSYIQNHKTGFVFCHPFAEEKLISHRIFVNAARQFAKKGIYCLRYDFMGHGDSEGNFEDSSINTRLDDLKCAVNFLKVNYDINSIGVFGVRLGASIAFLHSSKNTLDYLIVVSPVLDGNKYIEECLRSNLSTQMSTFKTISKNRNDLINDLKSGVLVNIDGYLLSKKLYEQIAVIDLIHNPNSKAKHILWINIAKYNKIDPSHQDAVDLLKGQGIDIQTINLNVPLFWKDSVAFDPICMGLQNTLSDIIDSITKH
jgi:alpha/beta superfamily hydrolase